MRTTIRRYAIFLVVFFSVAFPLKFSLADAIITFGPKETEIKGLIKYTVIGQYAAEFDEFKGVISFDPRSGHILSVDLEIEAASIHSSCQGCDKIVRSVQLLNTERFPKITFKSREILSDEKGYRVIGILDMHGVQKEMTFPFKATVTQGQGLQGKNFEISGQWVINRKEFDIIWNRLLDRGGVLVGNHITVKWGIKSAI